VKCRTDVEKLGPGEQAQAAELADFEAGLVAVLVVPVPADESDDVDEDGSEDELPDSLDGAEVLVPEPPWESLPESLPELLPALWREPLRESLRESLR
jgi:hypothetical protein